MKIGERIRTARKEAGLPQQKLADDLGIAKATVSRYETGKADLSTDMIVKISEILGVSVSYLFGTVEDADTAKISALKIPVHGSDDWEIIQEEWTEDGSQYFAYRVDDDSMAPKYTPGDMLIVKKQDQIGGPKDCVISVGDGSAVRRITIKSELAILQPANSSYAPETCSMDELNIIGIIVELRRKVI